jgi:hypothetical protein
VAIVLASNPVDVSINDMMWAIDEKVNGRTAARKHERLANFASTGVESHASKGVLATAT